jgi:large subunit ribosomal protein L29
MAKKTSVAELADAELFDRLRESKEELFNLRFQHVTGQLDNYARIKQVKKQIARLHTELRAREIAAAEALEAQAQEKVDG